MRSPHAARRIRALAISLVAVIPLAACGHYAAAFTPAATSQPQHADVVGEWIHRANDTSAQATLTMERNGTFSFTDVPSALFQDDGFMDDVDLEDAQHLVSGTGVWSLSDAPPEAFPPINTTVHTLTSDMSPAPAWTLAAPTHRMTSLPFSPVELVFEIGDPDLAVWFRFVRA